MAKKGKKKETRNRPELRTGGGRAAKLKRAEQRKARVAVTGTEAAELVSIRPGGPLGMILLLVLGWIGVGLVLFAGAFLERWNTLSYPDSLWLYVAFGFLAVAPVYARYTRSRLDADIWSAQALLVPLGLFAAERFLGPPCPDGGSCAAVGARGSLGLAGSLIVILVLAALTALTIRYVHDKTASNRPIKIRASFTKVIVAFVLAMIFIGVPTAVAVVGADILTRKSPVLVKSASEQVSSFCFPLGAAPELSVRPAPNGIASTWTTYAVRQSDEKRPGIGKKKVPTNWAKLDSLYPYEALIAFSGTEVASLSCRKVAPDSGNAVAADLVPNQPDSNPLNPESTGADFMPRFYTQGPLEEAPKAEAKPAAKK